MEYGLPRRVAEENAYSHMARIRGVGRNCSTIQRMDRTLLGTPFPLPPRASALLWNRRAVRRGTAPAGQRGREGESEGEKRTKSIN